MSSLKQDKGTVSIGISSCLLGSEVRFDGGHKRQPFLTDIFGKYVNWVSVCPEFEIGLGVPRPTLRLEKKDNAIKLIMPKTNQDHTKLMTTYAKKTVAALNKEGLCGYVFKKSSPSCGLFKVKVYGKNNIPQASGQGIFARHFVESYPDMPVEEEGRLNDPRIRENFISGVFSYGRKLNLLKTRVTKNKLFEFHAEHKYHLMARNQAALKRLGHFLAVSSQNKKQLTKEVVNSYFEQFFSIMKKVPTLKGHTNVLFHMAGYFSKNLQNDDRKELKELIEQYHQNRIPLIVPIVMIRHYARKFEVDYLNNQVYLYPHPDELALLNQL